MQFLYEAGLIFRERPIVDLRGAYLGGFVIGRLDLSGADLSGADLTGAHLGYANLWNANLRGARLSDAYLKGAHLEGADVREAGLGEYYVYVSPGPNPPRVDFVSGEPNVRAADLRDAALFKADLRRADLEGADLRGALLSGADLSGANLKGAKLSGAELSKTYISEEYLRAIGGADGADDKHTDRPRPYLKGADLRAADLRDIEGVTDEELERQAYSLKGATMPNGQLYEDWLKDKAARGERLTERQRNYLNRLKERDGRREDGDNPALA